MKIELELDDKGEIVGQAPGELDAIFKRIEAASHGKGYSKGMSEAAEAAKKQIADNVAAEVARMNALAPLEKEKHARTEEELANIKKQLLDVSSQGDRALKQREEDHAREILKRSQAIEKREARIRDLVKRTIRGDALAAGAREESLPELEVILGAYVGFDDDMKPFVRGDDGQPLQVHGKDVELTQFVKGYLDTHPHHRKPAGGQGGGARGGASFGGVVNPPTAEAAKQRIQTEGMSDQAVDDLFLATRKPRA